VAMDITTWLLMGLTQCSMRMIEEVLI